MFVSVDMTSWQFRPAMWNIGAAEMITGFVGRRGDRHTALHVGHHRDRAVEHRRHQEVDVAAVRQHHTLGAPGGAAGEEDDERIVLVDGDVGERGVGRVRLERREVPFELEHRQPVCQVDTLEALEPAAVAEQHLRFRELHRVRDLFARPPAVEPDRDGAERGGRPERERVLDGVGSDDGDPVTGPHPVLVAQCGGDCRDRLQDRRERVLPVREDHVRPVTHPLGRPAQQLDEAPRALRERRACGAPSTASSRSSKGAPGPVSVVRTDSGTASDGQERVVTRGGAATAPHRFRASPGASPRA